MKMEKSMYKVLFHLNCFEQGGAERVVSNLVNQLVMKDYEIIVATEWYGEVEFALDRRVRRVHVGLKQCDENKNRLAKILLRLQYLRKLIKEENPDLVISFTKKPNYRALMATIGTGIPIIPAVRQDPKLYYNRISDRLLMPILYRRADGCVFQTEEQMSYFPKSLQKKARVILNPVHDKYLDIKRPEIPDKTVVQSGRLVEFKNQSMLLHAFLKVHRKHPDYDLKIYGGDSFDGTKERLESIIQENQAESYITLMGASDSLEQQLSRASVYAFSSDYEGMPNALLEAMALGMPVVATDCPCGGPRMVIQNEINGLLIEPGDESAMEEGINRLIEDREFAEKLGENARKIKEKINGKVVLAQWEEYMEAVILWKKNRGDICAE
jgi:glycosyltransferase involved in cell wall biosynthesis